MAGGPQQAFCFFAVIIVAQLGSGECACVCVCVCARMQAVAAACTCNFPRFELDALHFIYHYVFFAAAQIRFAQVPSNLTVVDTAPIVLR